MYGSGRIHTKACHHARCQMPVPALTSYCQACPNFFPNDLSLSRATHTLSFIHTYTPALSRSLTDFRTHTVNKPFPTHSSSITLREMRRLRRQSALHPSGPDHDEKEKEKEKNKKKDERKKQSALHQSDPVHFCFYFLLFS